MTTDPTDLRGRLLAERSALIGEMEMGDHLAPGLLSLLGGVQLALMALDADRGPGAEVAPTPGGTAPLHEVLTEIANQLDCWATSRAPRPQDLAALSDEVEQLAERVLQGGRGGGKHMSVEDLPQRDEDPLSIIAARDQIIFALVSLNLGDLQAARWALAQALGALAELRVDLLRERWMDAAVPAGADDDETRQPASEAQ